MRRFLGLAGAVIFGMLAFLAWSPREPGPRGACWGPGDPHYFDMDMKPKQFGGRWELRNLKDVDGYHFLEVHEEGERSLRYAINGSYFALSIPESGLLILGDSVSAERTDLIVLRPQKGPWRAMRVTDAALRLAGVTEFHSVHLKPCRLKNGNMLELQMKGRAKTATGQAFVDLDQKLSIRWDRLWVRGELIKEPAKPVY